MARAEADVNWPEIQRELAGIDALRGLDVERGLIERFAREIAAGRLGPETNRLGVPFELPRAGDLDRLPAPGEARARLESTGRDAIEAGEIAVAVLNGGMATRFGGGVKGTVPVFGDRSFLAIKRDQARRLGPVPFVVMNSFATHARTLDHLAELGAREDALPFVQSVSLRLTPAGELFRDAEGRLSPYAPGHGDFGPCLRRSGTLEALTRRGVRALALSNVDNLGAELDPALIGYHLAHGLPLTCEVTPTRPGDAGGAPARVGGRLQLVEGFRFPPELELESLPFVNTNSFVLSVEALTRDHPLTWFYVEKRVGDRVAVQVERLVGELSVLVESAFLEVPRQGRDARYFPVKTPHDLEALRQRPELVERFGA